MHSRTNGPLEALKRPVTKALFDYLLSQRSPSRVRTVREALALTSNEFTVALRALERHGLAKRLRLGAPAEGFARLDPHLFIEATQEASELPRAHGLTTSGVSA